MCTHMQIRTQSHWHELVFPKWKPLGRHSEHLANEHIQEPRKGFYPPMRWHLRVTAKGSPRPLSGHLARYAGAKVDSCRFWKCCQGEAGACLWRELPTSEAESNYLSLLIEFWTLQWSSDLGEHDMGWDKISTWRKKKAAYISTWAELLRSGANFHTFGRC